MFSHSALDDIDALRLELDGERHILGAGIPWFAAPFGRDSLITSLQLLSVAPSLAAETLRTLAHYQGRVVDPWREEEPGKIMHELRRGEMARAGEVPHSPYYGTIDATPLWLVLLGETWRWLGDRSLLIELMPHAERALEWIERRLVQGRGWVRYQRTHDKGLENQGWKDSRDGVSFPDGAIAPTPIALVEVQGYVVGALAAMAKMTRALGDARARRAARGAGATRCGGGSRKNSSCARPATTRSPSTARTGRCRRSRPTPGHLLFVDAVRGETSVTARRRADVRGAL